MKKLLLIVSIVFIANICLADIPWVPEHLTNPNYDFKNRKIDCEQEMKTAHPFIPATIPDECRQPKPEQIKNIQPQTSKPTTQTKLNKFINNLLEE